jgi:hypothetical protein
MECDYRVKVVGRKIWAFRRLVRPGDFRASGSGQLDFCPDEIPVEMLRIARDVAQMLSLQSVAFDFLVGDNGPQIIEMSYCYGLDMGESSHWWDHGLNLNTEFFWPQDAILEDVLAQIGSGSARGQDKVHRLPAGIGIQSG